MIFLPAGQDSATTQVLSLPAILPYDYDTVTGGVSVAYWPKSG